MIEIITGVAQILIRTSLRAEGLKRVMGRSNLNLYTFCSLYSFGLLRSNTHSLASARNDVNCFVQGQLISKTFYVTLSQSKGDMWTVFDKLRLTVTKH